MPFWVCIVGATTKKKIWNLLLNFCRYWNNVNIIKITFLQLWIKKLSNMLEFHFLPSGLNQINTSIWLINFPEYWAYFSGIIIFSLIPSDIKDKIFLGLLGHFSSIYQKKKNSQMHIWVFPETRIWDSLLHSYLIWVRPNHLDHFFVDMITNNF